MSLLAQSLLPDRNFDHADRGLAPLCIRYSGADQGVWLLAANDLSTGKQRVDRSGVEALAEPVPCQYRSYSEMHTELDERINSTSDRGSHRGLVSSAMSVTREKRYACRPASWSSPVVVLHISRTMG